MKKNIDNHINYNRQIMLPKFSTSHYSPSKLNDVWQVISTLQDQFSQDLHLIMGLKRWNFWSYAPYPEKE